MFSNYKSAISQPDFPKRNVVTIINIKRDVCKLHTYLGFICDEELQRFLSYFFLSFFFNNAENIYRARLLPN